ncbi:GNAT family N-acetyltransferase [Streptomyces sp. NBC_01476]|uniref:GNAT family N-acetyltransferase n=1 Tax=Streptomyces sp. NBC_01476 TaxID=2903881 RepID=UPI002E30D02F|nr:GNAT family N-acetyltransferase [Streptomyces sp. NBC_01476]
MTTPLPLPLPLPGSGNPLAAPVAVPAPALFLASDDLLPRVRPATDADLPELHRLDKEVFQEHAYPYFVLRQFYDLYRDDLFVVDDGRTLLGYVLSGAASDRSRSWILGLAIDRRWRGHGLGRRLMAESLRRLRGQGVREVWLTVEPGNATAIELYVSLGFSYVDRRSGYFGPAADRLLMVLPLGS